MAPQAFVNSSLLGLHGFELSPFLPSFSPSPHTYLIFKVLSSLFFLLVFDSMPSASWLILKQYAKDLNFFFLPPVLNFWGASI